MTSNPETAHPTLPKRILGPNHLSVGPIGLGCRTMTWAYGSRDRAESMATIRHAVDLGVTLFDTADIYGPFANEELVGEAIQGYRHQIVLATSIIRTRVSFRLPPMAGRSIFAKRARIRCGACAPMLSISINSIELIRKYRSKRA
jgi:aryl-alcohol dehydrogenase-like predicted oxidoreductase